MDDSKTCPWFIINLVMPKSTHDRVVIILCRAYYLFDLIDILSMMHCVVATPYSLKIRLIWLIY